MSTATTESKPSIDSKQSAWLDKIGPLLGVRFNVITPEAASPSSASGPGSSSAGAATVEKVQPTSGSKRVVKGGGGYVFEQFADGRIFIIESPKRGKERFEVTDPKAYKAILAQIGPFPQAPIPVPSPAAKPTPTANVTQSEGVLDQMREVLDGAMDGIGKALGDAADFLFSDDADKAKGAANSSPVQSPPQVADKKTPPILGDADTETEKKLAEFTQSMSAIIVTVGDEKVSVRPPYHINVSGSKSTAEKNRKDNPKVAKLIKDVFGGQGGDGATTGKATPKQMADFLQKAVDDKIATDTSAEGLRDFLDKYGVSTDCSGLAVQALNFLADGDLVRGTDEEIDAGNTNTDTLHTYEPVTTPADLTAGDLMVKPGTMVDDPNGELLVDKEGKPRLGKDGKQLRAKQRKPGHVRLVIDVDFDKNDEKAILFTTVESTGDDDIVGKNKGDGVGQRRWRFPDSSKLEGLQIQQSDATFKDATSADRGFDYRRYKKK